MSDSIVAKVYINGELCEKEVIKKQNGFDAETGEPVYEYLCQDGFDGETGQPVYRALTPDGFDGETGQPIYKEAGNNDAPAITPSPASAPAFEKKAKSFKDFLPLIIGGAALITVVIIVIAGLLSGAFLSKRNKVALAAYKTAKDSTIGEVLLKGSGIYGSDKKTVSIDGDISAFGYSADVEATIAENCKKGLFGINAKADVAGVLDQSANLYFDDSMIAVSLPDISRDVYSYNYKNEGDGFIADLIDESTKGDISDVNSVLKCLSDIMKKTSAGNRAVKKAVMKAYKQVDVTSQGRDEFEVDGKDRNCKCYEMTITGDNIVFLLSELSDASTSVYGEIIEDALENIANLTGEDLSDFDINDEDTFEELADEFSDMDDIVIDFYIYGGKLAAVETEIDRAKLTVEFRGGDKRCSNIVFTFKEGNSKESIKLKSEMNGNTEEGAIYYDKTSIASYEYNTKTGRYNISVPSEGSVQGVFKVSGHEIKTTNEINSSRLSGKINVSITDKARISKPKGSYFDIGDADEDELEEIVDELMGEIREAMGGYGDYGYDDYDYDYDYDDYDYDDYEDEWDDYF